MLFVALMMGVTQMVWAADKKTENGYTVLVNIEPDKDAGTVTVSSISSAGVVTMTVTPASGYYTKKSLITTEKMVDASSARQRSSSILAGDIDITGTEGEISSETTFSFTIPSGYTGANVTVRFYQKSEGYTQVFSISDLKDKITNNPSGSYELACDMDASGLTASITGFTGTLDGGLHTISNLGVPLFSTANGTNGTIIIKNVILDNVNISSGNADGNTGAIACVAEGATRIYNCGILSGSVGGTKYVGGLVGLLKGTSRVINCYSYADITGGTDRGGIVGYNNETTNSQTANLKTMVMNCMFYGDISTSGTANISPIYGGTIINNRGDKNGVGNYNYFLAESSFMQKRSVAKKYNCALMAEKRYLQRFEFFRHLLNSHRGLAAWWATGDYENKDEIMKWVMEPSQIGTAIPYPILKKPGKYPSVVNIDAEHAQTGLPRNKGGKLGELEVTIQMGSQGSAPFGAPTGAALKSDKEKDVININITDKDPDHFNFNYYKIQLPYYNDYGTKNYTGNRVVTGWKIVSITGGTPGKYATGADVITNADGTITMPYNFADRNCTNKDLYGEGGSNRIFNQGAYWDVPEGVTKITIEPYWAKAAYVADAYADVVYNAEMKTAYNVANVGGGQIYTGESTFNGDDQLVYTTIGNAVTALNPNGSYTVNDYAVVLVGNYHQYNSIEGGNKPYTVTSVDLDHDNEPDYSFILRFDGRTPFHPVKYDFINMVGLGMAQKSNEGKATFNFGIPTPKYWFELTNTSLFRVTQFEYDTNKSGGRTAAPIILQGGVMEQWVSGQNDGISNKTTYFHLGGNVWFKEFHLGCHQDKKDLATKHSPVSVTGGDFENFYLTGLYAAKTTNNDDNAECYINGGRFGIMAGAGMEGIGHETNHTNGNINWQIDNADINEFYGGGINGAKPIQGNITTVISNSHVGVFCGGPKFGDMVKTNTITRTVRTTAKDCVFGTFFGAGYGGNSYNRQAPFNATTVKYNIKWNEWVNGDITFGTATNNANFNGYHQEYKSAYDGVSTQIAYQFLPMSDNASNVGRLWIEYVKFSLAKTRDVKSELVGCTINGNFYGGGNLGKVAGPVSSTLKDCIVNGDGFGAGYWDKLPTG